MSETRTSHIQTAHVYVRGMQGSSLWKFVAMAVLTACSPGGVNEHPAAPTAAQANSVDVFRFKIGALDAIALKDGDIQVPNDGKTIGLGQPKEALDRVLANAGRSTDTLDLSIQPLLVRDGERTLLFDTGAANVSFAKAGRLPQSLRSAGVAPSEVTDIFISHAHADHVGGLVTTGGTLAFPNAAIHLSAPEWDAMKAHAKQAALVGAIAPKVVAFQPNAEIVPSVTAVAVEGHTPGHSAYRIASGSESLLYIGDTAHHSVMSVEQPDWSIDFDTDDAKARASRRALLQRAADGDLRIYAGHFPFPGLGRVRVRGESFVWVPEASAGGR